MTIKQVLKFCIPPSIATDNGYFTIKAPVGAKFLSVAYQAKIANFVIWANCDVGKPEYEYTFRMVLTGEKFDPKDEVFRLVGTVQTPNGDYVLHIFEVDGHLNQFKAKVNSG